MLQQDDADNLRTSEGRLRKYDDRVDMLGARATPCKLVSVVLDIDATVDDGKVADAMLAGVDDTDELGIVVDWGSTLDTTGKGGGM